MLKGPVYYMTVSGFCQLNGLDFGTNANGEYFVEVWSIMGAKILNQ